MWNILAGISVLRLNSLIEELSRVIYDDFILMFIVFLENYSNCCILIGKNNRNRCYMHIWFSSVRIYLDYAPITRD